MRLMVTIVCDQVIPQQLTLILSSQWPPLQVLFFLINFLTRQRRSPPFMENEWLVLGEGEAVKRRG